MSQTKVCTKCLIEKELSLFYKKACGKYGVDSRCKICMSAYSKKHSALNRKAISEKNRQYRLDNIEMYKEKDRIYYMKNRKKIISDASEYRRKRKKTDKKYVLRNKIRKIISESIKRVGFSKNSRTHSILGCDFETFLAYLNDNKYGFIAGNDGIDLDHIIPVSSAKTEEEIYKLNHYTNFQLLPSEYNRNFKRTNEWDADDFEEWLKNNITNNEKK